jgi:dienelactone hydrolase
VKRSLGLALLAAALAQSCAAAGALPGRVRVPSLDGTAIEAYLFRPQGAGPHPAVVFLHGCGGLVSSRGAIQARETDWASRLTALGYVVLMVDSFSSRGVREMCSPRSFQQPVYAARPKDAYAALGYLQAQDFVRPDRVGVMGWSQGGGVILYSIRAASLGRPARLPRGDFRAAVAFYPGSCREGAHNPPWTSAIPLLVLVGDRDVWTPAEPCNGLVEGAVSRGSKIEMQIYPGAYHDFDWPNLAVHALPAYRTSAGVVPVTGTDPAARADALARVPEFLAKYLPD